MTFNNFFIPILVVYFSTPLLVSVTTASDHRRWDSPKDRGYLDLVAWVTSHGGRVDDRMAITNRDGIRGVIALSDIEEGAELLHCPWELVIGSSGIQDQMQTEDDMCNVVKIMASEVRLGDKSTGWPYLHYIELPRLGSMWGQAAVDELQGLPPSQELDRHLQWFSMNCGGGDPSNFDDATIHALVAFISRASEVGMVPIYDLLNHHNGEKNAKLFLTETGVDLRTVRPVQRHQQLYLSYGLKTSFQMYRDYGFVESWPSLWSFRDAVTHDNHVFALFPDGIAAVHPSSEFLKEIWNGGNRSMLESQSYAKNFTMSRNKDQLDRFVQSAKAKLDGLPTTYEEDKEILRRNKDELQMVLTSGSSQSNIILEDIMGAVQYRLAFKQAVLEALVSAEAAMIKELEMEL